MKAAGVKDKNGNEHKLNLVDKVIFVHMMDKAKQYKNNHYETQETIASEFNLDVRVVAKALKVLVASGLASARKERNPSISPHLSWYYTGVDTSLRVYEVDRVKRSTRESRAKKTVDTPAPTDTIDTNTKEEPNEGFYTNYPIY
jgi:hypothetical protein